MEKRATVRILKQRHDLPTEFRTISDLIAGHWRPPHTIDRESFKELYRDAEASKAVFPDTDIGEEVRALEYVKRMGRLHDELRKLGLYLKIDKRRGSPRSNKTIRYEYAFVSALRPKMPEHVPVPYALLEIDGTAGYLLEFLPMENLKAFKPWMLQYSEKIPSQLEMIIRKMHESNLTHMDLCHNTFIRKDNGDLVVIDPLLPSPFKGNKGGIKLEVRIAWDHNDLAFLLKRIEDSKEGRHDMEFS